MPLNIISNHAANVAHRNLLMSNDKAADSIGKISSGSRVLSARDDAAAMAIGAGLRSEVSALRAASVNAGQAVSLLQVADGSMAQIDQILVRMKALAIQAGSGQYGDTERSLIDAEYQQLLGEIDRIAADTEFNGRQLLDGSQANTLLATSNMGADGVKDIAFGAVTQPDDTFRYTYDQAEEVLTLTKLGVDTVTTSEGAIINGANLTADNVSLVADDNAPPDVFRWAYTAATRMMTVTNYTTSETASVYIEEAFDAGFGPTVTTVPTNESLQIEVPQFGIKLQLEDGFDRTANSSQTAVSGAVADPTVDTNVATYTATTFAFQAAGTGLLGSSLSPVFNAADVGRGVFDQDSGTLKLTAEVTGNGTFKLPAVQGLSYSWTSGGSGQTAEGAASEEITIAAGTAETIALYGNGELIGTFDLDFDVTSGDDNKFDIEMTFNGLLFNDQRQTRTGDQVSSVDITAFIDAVAGAGNNMVFGQETEIEFADFGVTMTLDNSFDRNNDILNAVGIVSGSTADGRLTSPSFAEEDGVLGPATMQALLDLGFSPTTGFGFDPGTGILTLQVEEAAGNVLIRGVEGLHIGNGDGQDSDTIASAGTMAFDLKITDANGKIVKLGEFSATAAATAGATGDDDELKLAIQIGKGLFANNVDPDADVTELTFRIGSGPDAEDQITLAIDAVNTRALGLAGSSVATKDAADLATVIVTDALTELNRARSNVGGLQNRLDYASANIRVSMENTEASRSALLDLDVAIEMSEFTSNQILVQAGVAMLSQANQLPQNLLRLFQ